MYCVGKNEINVTASLVLSPWIPYKPKTEKKLKIKAEKSSERAVSPSDKGSKYINYIWGNILISRE